MVIVKRPYYKEDREIEDEEFQAQALAGGLSEAMFQRLMAKPTLLRGYVTHRDFEILYEAVRSVRQTVRMHKTVLATLQERIGILEARNREQSVSLGKATSVQSVNLLRKTFGLPEITEEIDEDVLANMKGMLKGKSREKIDSVELLHQIRGE